MAAKSLATSRLSLLSIDATYQRSYRSRCRSSSPLRAGPRPPRSWTRNAGVPSRLAIPFPWRAAAAYRCGPVARSGQTDVRRGRARWSEQARGRNHVPLSAARSVVLAAASSTWRASTRPRTRLMEPVSCSHHNYVAEERYEGMYLLVTRKGAIRAGSGDFGIIPGSMGTGSYIVKGLGNEASFNSASHGAGRKMSRNAAKRRFSTRDLEEQTRGVECRKDSGVVDEIPGAYKPIEKVMEQQRDLVQVVAKLKQVICVKG
ncbi:RtcB family protein [Streptomyces sp. CA-135486]|uniref:RtcB family protein n=1 Tax=Streptomyces sp. CA-135486 TaxID=3240049 RepID=UPI003D9494C0